MPRGRPRKNPLPVEVNDNVVGENIAPTTTENPQPTVNKKSANNSVVLFYFFSYFFFLAA